MVKLKYLIRKNMKLFLSNKKSYFLFFFVPIILFLLLGAFYYNNNDYKIILGGVNSNSLVGAQYSKLLLEQGFQFYEMESREECIKEIEKSNINICILFPKEGIQDSINIKLLVDNTKPSLSQVGQNILGNFFELQSDEIKTEQTLEILDIFDSLESVSQEQIDKINKNIVEVQDNIKDINTIISRLKEKDEIFESSENVEFNLIENYRNQRTTFLSNLEVDIEDMLGEVEDIQDDNDVDSSINSSATSIKTTLEDLSISLESFSNNLDEFKNLTQYLESDSSNEIGFNRDLIILENLIDTNIEIISSLENITKDSNRVVELKENLPFTDPDIFVSPLNIEIDDAFDNGKGNEVTNFFPSLLTSFLVITILIVSSTMLFTERKSPGYLRTIMSTCSSQIYVLGISLSSLIMIYVQIFLILFIFNIFFMGDWSINFLSVLFMLVPIIYMFILIGFLIGYISKTINAVLLTNFFLFVFMFLFSGNLLPLEAQNFQSLQNLISLINPYLVAETSIKKLFLIDLTFQNIFLILLPLLNFIFVCFILCCFLQSYDMKKLMFYTSNIFTSYLKKRTKKLPNVKKWINEISDLIEEKLRI